MKKMLLLLILYAVYAAAAEKQGDPYANVEHFYLKNGMQVYLLADEKAENTSIELEVGVGYDIENSETYGLAHLVEHLVFRDRRVPYNDYLDFLEEEGATYVNGMTGPFQTRYLATIDSNRSYWIAEQFATMLFDKNVTKDDLEIERGALQTEIGEYTFLKKAAWHVFSFVRDVTPPQDDIYTDEFSLPPRKKPPAPYFAQVNNSRFDLDEVLRHYHQYYYPANVTLKIVGNFDSRTMKARISKSFGRFTREGNLTVKRPVYHPAMNQKPFTRFYDGGNENVGILGAKYLRDDYQKVIILEAYMESAASRLQRELRNERGQNYGVSAYMNHDRSAGIAGVYFDGLHEHFEENTRVVGDFLSEDAAALDRETIQQALDDYAREHYTSREHDSASLMRIIGELQTLRRDYGLKGTTPYTLFASITPAAFRSVVAQTLQPQARYTVIWREYYLFPLDLALLSTLFLILIIVAVFKTYRIDYRRLGLRYTKRDVTFERRLSNRFLGFLLIMFVLIVTSLAWEWIEYVVMLLVTGTPHYPATIDAPCSYPVMLFDWMLFLAFFVVVYKFGVRYFARLDVTGDALYLVGNNIRVIEKSRIISVESIAWHPRLFFKISGLFFMFWKPLVAVTLSDGSKLYLRAKNAAHLVEDLENALPAD